MPAPTVDPRDLILFSAVVRDGGFSAAARGLGLSKQAVSERIGRLEAGLGVRLFTLTVSCPVVFGRRVLVPVCVTLRARYPSLHIEARLSDRQVRLIEEGFDVVVRVGALEDSTLQVKRLGSVRTVLVASRAFVKAHGPPRNATALEAAPCLTARRDDRWRVRGQLVTPRAVLTIDDLEALADAALHGLGIARLPEPLCEAELRSGRLVELLKDTQAEQAQVHALLAPGRYRPPKVRVFLDALSAALA